MNTTPPITQRAPSAEEPGRHMHRPPVSERPTFREILEQVVPFLFFVPVAGPPVILLFGPWLLLVLLLIPPAAGLITLVLVTVVAAALLAALVAVVASPYILVRHLRARHAARRERSPSVRGPAPAAGAPGPYPRRAGWFPLPGPGGPAPQASLVSAPAVPAKPTQEVGMSPTALHTLMGLRELTKDPYGQLRRTQRSD